MCCFFTTVQGGLIGTQSRLSRATRAHQKLCSAPRFKTGPCKQSSSSCVESRVHRLCTSEVIKINYGTERCASHSLQSQSCVCVLKCALSFLFSRVDSEYVGTARNYSVFPNKALILQPGIQTPPRDIHMFTRVRTHTHLTTHILKNFFLANKNRKEKKKVLKCDKDDMLHKQRVTSCCCTVNPIEAGLYPSAKRRQV